MKIKYEFGGTYLHQRKVAFNLNPEVDVGGGGVQHTHTHTDVRGLTLVELSCA